MNPIELTPSIALPCRPVIASRPLTGEVAIALPVQAAGVVHLAQLSWRRGDPLETTDILLDPEPAGHRDVLAILDAVEDTCKVRHAATPDPHNAVLCQQAAQRVWTYAADYGDAWAAGRVPSTVLATV